MRLINRTNADYLSTYNWSKNGLQVIRNTILIGHALQQCSDRYNSVLSEKEFSNAKE